MVEEKKGEDVFMTLEITNKTIYQKLLDLEAMGKDTFDQATLTNGRVTTLESKLNDEICPKIADLQDKSIIMFVSKLKVIVIILISVGAFLAGTKLTDLIDNLK